MAGKPGVMLYFDLIPALEGLTTHDKGVLLDAILRFGHKQEIPKLTKRLALIWPMIQQRLVSDEQRYFLSIRRKEYAAYVRWSKRHGTEVSDFLTWLEEQGYYVENETYYRNASERMAARVKTLNQRAIDLYGPEDEA